MAVALGINSGFVESAPVDDPEGSNGTIDQRSLVTNDTSPADATTITEIGWWCDTATEESNFEVGLYDSDGAVVPGEAGTRLYVDASNAKGTDAGWKRCTGLSWAISGNHSYWIGVQLDDTATLTNMNYNSIDGTGYDALTSQTALPNPFGGGALADNNGMYAIYAVYTTGAGGETREFAPLPAGISATSTSIAAVIRPVTPAITGASATGAAIAAILREFVESVAVSSATAEIVVTITGVIELSASMTGVSATSAVYELILREILLSLSGVSIVSEITLDVIGAAVQDQEGFRFRNDDGSEVTATWRAVQDTDISLQSGVNFRLRFVINATGDPAASQYQVEYKKNTDADWSRVV